MALQWADRVKETSTTTGTGTLNLAGAATGYRTFVAAAGTLARVVYAIKHQTADEWEVGIGTVTDAGTDTLSRETVLSSTNSGSLVSFSSGTKDVWLDMPAEQVKAISNPNVWWQGNFDVWQVNTSWAAIADTTHIADGWRYGKAGAMVHTVSRSTDVPTVAQSGCLSNYSLLVDCTTVDSSIAATDYAAVFGAIEGYDLQQLAQKDFTVSFWVKATKTGIYCIAFRNVGLDRTYIAEYTVNTTDTWEFKSITIPASPSAGTWDYTNGVGMYVTFGLACGATYHTAAGSWTTGSFIASSNQVNACDDTANNFRLAQVKIETGKVATPFVVQPFDAVLKKAQRYFSKNTTYATVVPPTGSLSQWVTLGVPSATIVNNQRYFSPVYFPRPMRAVPTVTVYPYTTPANTGRVTSSGGTDLAAGSGTVEFTTESYFGIWNNSGGSVTSSGVYVIFHWSADARF